MENRLSYAEVRGWRRESLFSLSLRSCLQNKMFPNVHAQSQNSFFCIAVLKLQITSRGMELLLKTCKFFLWLAPNYHERPYSPSWLPAMCICLKKKSHLQMNRVQFSKYFYGSISLISLFKMAAMTSCSVLFFFSGMVLEWFTTSKRNSTWLKFSLGKLLQ